MGATSYPIKTIMPFPPFCNYCKTVKVVWLFLVHVISAQLWQCRDNIWTDRCFELLLNSSGSPRSFAVVLPLSFCLVESLLCYHVCCFSSYCSGVTSIWTPSRFTNCSEIMHLTNRGYTNIHVAFHNETHDCSEWPESFIKEVLMSFQDCFRVRFLLVARSHLVCANRRYGPWHRQVRGSQLSQLKAGRWPRWWCVVGHFAPLGMFSTWQAQQLVGAVRAAKERIIWSPLREV